MHIRCKACRQYLAGPLQHQRLQVCSDLKLYDFSLFGEIQFSSDSFQSFTPQSEADLLVHAQWCELGDPIGQTKVKRRANANSSFNRLAMVAAVHLAKPNAHVESK